MVAADQLGEGRSSRWRMGCRAGGVSMRKAWRVGLLIAMVVVGHGRTVGRAVQLVMGGQHGQGGVTNDGPGGGVDNAVRPMGRTRPA